MWRRATLAWLTCAVLGLVAAPAWADDRSDCNGDKIDVAIAACTRVIRAGKSTGRDLAMVYYGRGRSYRLMRDNDRAIADYNESIKLNSSYPHAFLGRGNAWKSKKDLDRAIADFSEAIRLDPKFASAYFNRGDAYDDKGDTTRALADLDAAIRLDPNDSDSFILRGVLWKKKGDLDRAIRDYTEAIRLDPKSSMAYFNRAISLDDKEQTAGAIADLDQSLRLDPSFLSAYNFRGSLHRKNNDLERARADYNVVLASKDPASEGLRQTARDRLAALPSFETTSTPPKNDATTPPANNVISALSNALTPQTPIRRAALVIGNSAYKAVPALPNARRDAETVAASLRQVGFESVKVELDLTREGLINALRLFAREADRADWALIYFAGHGLEVGGTNFLIPVDARLETDRDVNFEAVPLDAILSSVESAKRLRLVLLDACRDNPFASQMRRNGATRSIGRGLARVEPDSGTLVVYASKHGEVALDGDGQNSPFVSAFVKNLPQPGVEIRRLFDLVRDDVMEATRRRQQPFSYGSVPGREDFYFVSR
jgi:tetratricopeptide (TPR) repeat protein